MAVHHGEAPGHLPDRAHSAAGQGVHAASVYPSPAQWKTVLTMTQADFVTALEHELQNRRVPFNLADVLEFAGSVWPIARDEPEPVGWADEVLTAVLAENR